MQQVQPLSPARHTAPSSKLVPQRARRDWRASTNHADRPIARAFGRQTYLTRQHKTSCGTGALRLPCRMTHLYGVPPDPA